MLFTFAFSRYDYLFLCLALSLFLSFCINHLMALHQQQKQSQYWVHINISVQDVFPFFLFIRTILSSLFHSSPNHFDYLMQTRFNTSKHVSPSSSSSSICFSIRPVTILMQLLALRDANAQPFSWVRVEEEKNSASRFSKMVFLFSWFW